MCHRFVLCGRLKEPDSISTNRKLLSSILIQWEYIKITNKWYEKKTTLFWKNWDGINYNKCIKLILLIQWNVCMIVFDSMYDWNKWFALFSVSILKCLANFHPQVKMLNALNRNQFILIVFKFLATSTFNWTVVIPTMHRHVMAWN